MPTLSAPLEEAREHLRVIRQTMERSTKYSTLSGLSGVLIGLVAIAGVWLTQFVMAAATHRYVPLLVVDPGNGWIAPPGSPPVVADYFTRGLFPFWSPLVTQLAAIWTTVLVLAVAIDFLANKRRAARVGKSVVSPIGAHIVVAALPGFLAGGVLTAFLIAHGLLLSVWGVWMLCYGLAICAVGLFSVKPVSLLGGAFVLAGAATLLLPPALGLPMMAVTFGGFHILYGVLMARRHGW